jgi:predicted RNase H-like HicB family nuclease
VRQVIVYPDEDGFWVVEVPSLPGCNTQGATREEALENARDAIEGYIKALEQDGLPVLQPQRSRATKQRADIE